MKIIFDKNNQITVTDKEGKIILKSGNFNTNSLINLGFSESEVKQIEQMLEKRKYSFY